MFRKNYNNLTWDLGYFLEKRVVKIWGPMLAQGHGIDCPLLLCYCLQITLCNQLSVSYVEKFDIKNKTIYENGYKFKIQSDSLVT